MRTLAEDGYTSAEVRVAPSRTEIIIRATRTRERRVRGIRVTASVLQKECGVPMNSVDRHAQMIENRVSCAMARHRCRSSTLSKQTDPWNPARTTQPSVTLGALNLRSLSGARRLRGTLTSKKHHPARQT